jgi:all-trans-retinol 13,14-reductase
MAEAINRTAYKQVTLGDTWDVIVIGSGILGLTAAVLLSIHGGKRILVLERHYAIGGFTHTFHRPGYEWDVGLHYIGQVRRGDIAKLRDYVDEFAGGEMVFFSHQTVWDGEGSHEPEGVERSGARRAESKPLGVAFLQ